MKILKLNELEGHDVFEFMQGEYNEEHWKIDSIFLTEEDFAYIYPFITEALDDFNYYGPNEVTKEIWIKIKNNVHSSFSNSEDNKEELMKFLDDIDIWVKLSLLKYNCFSICGI